MVVFAGGLYLAGRGGNAGFYPILKAATEPILTAAGTAQLFKSIESSRVKSNFCKPSGSAIALTPRNHYLRCHPAWHGMVESPAVRQ